VRGSSTIEDVQTGVSPAIRIAAISALESPAGSGANFNEVYEHPSQH